MDVFAVREELVADYRSFTSGFVEVRDPRIREYVDRRLEDGVQWPDPWISLNPSFEPGGSIDELVDEGILAEECRRIFRVKTSINDPGSATLVLHRHQREAVDAALPGGRMC